MQTQLSFSSVKMVIQLPTGRTSSKYVHPLATVDVGQWDLSGSARCRNDSSYLHLATLLNSFAAGGFPRRKPAPLFRNERLPASRSKIAIIRSVPCISACGAARTFTGAVGAHALHQCFATYRNSTHIVDHSSILHGRRIQIREVWRCLDSQN